MRNALGVLRIGLGILFGMSLYLLPLGVAILRRKSFAKVANVAVINVLFGWTFIGYVVALAMARSNRN